MSSKETTASALTRFRTDVEEVRRVLGHGRAALPTLAMGSDGEGVVHLGIDHGGAVSQLDLDPFWRDAVGDDGIGRALTDALHHASRVRVGDWAAALPRFPGSQVRPDPALDSVPDVEQSVDGVSVRSDGADLWVAADPGWVSRNDDDAVRGAVLGAFAAMTGAATGPAPEALADVRSLQTHVHAWLHRSASALPRFMRASVQTAIERVHVAATDTLAVPVAAQAVAGDALRSYGADLGRCLRACRGPASLPEAADSFAAATLALTGALDRAGRPRGLGGLLRRRTAN